jgi:hypothetical protein
MEHSSFASQATASGSLSSNVPPHVERTNGMEGPHLAPALMRLPTMNKDDVIFMEVATFVIKLRAHRMKRGDLGVSITSALLLLL